MIIVCGSGRSGTSAVASVLHHAGIALGRDLIGPDEHNAEGYFEERSVVAINDAILNAAGMREWFATASRAEIIEASQAYAVHMRAAAGTATPAWKDPRFCWTLEAWLPYFAEKPGVIVCLRNPAEVAASTMQYYGLVGDDARRAAEHAWAAGYERLLEIVSDFRLPAMAAEYRALVTNPGEAVRPLARFVGRPLDAAAVRTTLRHHAEREIAQPLRALYARVAALGG